jgi:hypothetical protein
MDDSWREWYDQMQLHGVDLHRAFQMIPEFHG